MRIALAILCVAAIWGCGPAPAAPPAAVSAPMPASPPPPLITGLPAKLTLKQRSEIDVPGTAGALRLSITDITGGQVQASIRAGKEIILKPVSMRQGNRQTFDYQKRRYELKLAELSNALIGQDFATFELVEDGIATAPGVAVLTEGQKIDRLIAQVESLEGAKFIRNGTEHSPADAAKHLRDKRKSAGDKVKTAEEFIEQIGSRSSLTGEEYTIRYADGRVVKAGEYLRDELRKAAPKEEKPSPKPQP